MESGNILALRIQLLVSRSNLDRQHLGHTPFSGNSTHFRDPELMWDVKVVVDIDDDPDGVEVVGVHVVGMDFHDVITNRKCMVYDVSYMTLLSGSRSQ
jgi:hypothetical protein